MLSFLIVRRREKKKRDGKVKEKQTLKIGRQNILGISEHLLQSLKKKEIERVANLFFIIIKFTEFLFSVHHVITWDCRALGFARDGFPIRPQGFWLNRDDIRNVI